VARDTSILLCIFITTLGLCLALGQQVGVDVGQNSPGRDGNIAQQLAQLLIILDRQLQQPCSNSMTGGQGMRRAWLSTGKLGLCNLQSRCILKNEG